MPILSERFRSELRAELGNLFTANTPPFEFFNPWKTQEGDQPSQAVVIPGSKFPTPPNGTPSLQKIGFMKEQSTHCIELLLARYGNGVLEIRDIRASSVAQLDPESKTTHRIELPLTLDAKTSLKISQLGGLDMLLTYDPQEDQVKVSPRR